MRSKLSCAVLSDHRQFGEQIGPITANGGPTQPDHKCPPKRKEFAPERGWNEYTSEYLYALENKLTGSMILPIFDETLIAYFCFFAVKFFGL